MEIRKLNAIRGLAALIVVVSHYSNATGLLGGLLGEGAGQIGVALFFMLSGFLMSWLYIEREPSGREIGRFLIARAARVGPLLVLVVLLSYALWRLGVHGVFYPIPSAADAACHLALLCGVSVLWTIAPEVHFYLLFPALWWLYRQGSAYLYLTSSAIVAVWALARADPHALQWTWGRLDMELSLFSALPYFLSGSLIGCGYRGATRIAALQNHAAILALALVPLTFPNLSALAFGYRPTPWQDAGVFCTLSLAFYCLAVLVPDDNRLLGNRAGDFIGRVSYSLYLLHLPLLNLLRAPLKDSPGLLLLPYLAIALLVSYLSFRWVELPARTALRRFAAPRD
jgi:peptidoglycan/LPS O-acetylase OafA/YrhL